MNFSLGAGRYTTISQDVDNLREPAATLQVISAVHSTNQGWGSIQSDPYVLTGSKYFGRIQINQKKIVRQQI